MQVIHKEHTLIAFEVSISNFIAIEGQVNQIKQIILQDLIEYLRCCIQLAGYYISVGQPNRVDFRNLESAQQLTSAGTQKAHSQVH